MPSPWRTNTPAASASTTTVPMTSRLLVPRAAPIMRAAPRRVDEPHGTIQATRSIGAVTQHMSRLPRS